MPNNVIAYPTCFIIKNYLYYQCITTIVDSSNTNDSNLNHMEKKQDLGQFPQQNNGKEGEITQMRVVSADFGGHTQSGDGSREHSCRRWG